MTGEPLRLAVIVAVAENGVIGSDNELPWHLPGDLRYFRRVTMGKPVIMGRRTFDSIGRPLQGRTNIVISRNRNLRVAGVRVAASLDQALALAEDSREVLVIGGAGIYAAAIPRADRLYVTEVHAAFEGDTLLPAVAWRDWREVRRERHAAAAEDSCDYSFVVYERRPA